MSREREGILFCLCGPAGVGKTVLGSELLCAQGLELRRSVSVTTRSARPDERQGASYDFVSEAEFKRRVEGGEFFEWEIVHGKYYGTPRRFVEEAVSKGQDLLLIIDIRGALNIKKRLPLNTVIVFVAAPSFEVLRQRLLGRGAVDEEELKVRLDTARQEYQRVTQGQPGECGVDYFIVNDNLETAMRAWRSIVEGERHRVSRWRAEAMNRILSTK